MRSLSTAGRTMDLVVSRRIFNTCWISASLGISIIQMRVLAEAWHADQHALVPACLVSAWTLGSLAGMRTPGSPRVWGSSFFLACTLLWLISPSLVSWHLPLGIMPRALVSVVALAMVALVLGASSTAWLARLRSWPSVGERTSLVRSLVGLTVGLVVAWMLPALAGLIALTCCLPLFALDFFPPVEPLSQCREGWPRTGSADTGMLTGGNCNWIGARCPRTGGGPPCSNAPRTLGGTCRSPCWRAVSR